MILLSIIKVVAEITFAVLPTSHERDTSHGCDEWKGAVTVAMES